MTIPNRGGFRANDRFGARLDLDRLIEYAEANDKGGVKKWRGERAKYPDPPAK